MTNSAPVTKGFIHSFESFGTLDGPGIRFVVFMSGCHLTCKYCHNIDMKFTQGRQQYGGTELLEMILKNKPYFDSSGGGVTFSGGDPLYQPAFLKEMLKLCQENNIHTAVDTSLYTSKPTLDQIMPHTDLFMVSLKHFDPQMHHDLTGVPNKPILENLEYLSQNGQRLWLRYLLLPGYTDTAQNLEALINFANTINFEKLELLTYHTMGVPKWTKLGLPYELSNVPLPSESQALQIKERLERAGIPVSLCQ